MSAFVTIWHFAGRYKYVIVVPLLVLFVCFVGEDSLWANYKRYRQLNDMRDQQSAYRQEYERDSVVLQRLENDPKEAEHVARELYLMKREGEDVFLFAGDPTSQEAEK